MSGHDVLVATHATAALICLLLGGYQLRRRPKGDGAHRVAGWIWIAGMTFVATSSFAIRDLREGRLSLLHVLSVVTIVSLILGIVAARRHDITGHKSNMLGSWMGLVGAFVGALAVPVRAVPTFVVSNPVGALTAFGAVVALTGGLVGTAHVIVRIRQDSAGRRRGLSQG